MSNAERDRLALAARLRMAREMAGLSQGQVARLLGISRPSVSEWEAGRRRVSSEELAQLVEIYGVSSEWVLGRDESGDARQDRISLAARELAKLRPEDLNRLLSLLRTLRTPEARK